MGTLLDHGKQFNAEDASTALFKLEQAIGYRHSDPHPYHPWDALRITHLVDSAMNVMAMYLERSSFMIRFKTEVEAIWSETMAETKGMPGQDSSHTNCGVLYQSYAGAYHINARDTDFEISEAGSLLEQFRVLCQLIKDEHTMHGAVPIVRREPVVSVYAKGHDKAYRGPSLDNKPSGSTHSIQISLRFALSTGKVISSPMQKAPGEEMVVFA